MITRSKRARFAAARLPLALALSLAALAALVGCDTHAGGTDAGALDVEVPAQCTGCPRDCCRLPDDAGFACMNFDHRNAVTMECSCGPGPACEQPRTCCPPYTDPAPQQPATCVDTPGQCDPRPTGM